jgi:hypothetical protein
MRCEIKVMFDEISLKLRQMNWNVIKNNANVVADELPSQLMICTCLTSDIWTQRCRCRSTRFCALRCHPPKLASFQWIGAKSFRLYYGHPKLAGKCLVRAIQRTQFCAKCAKYDLQPTDILRRNFYFEMKGVHRYQSFCYTTLFMVFSVAYYMEWCIAINFYCSFYEIDANFP